MPSDAGKSVLLRMLEMFATGEVDAASDTIAADYREHDRGRTTRRHGVAGFCETVRAARSEFVDLDVWPEALIAAPDQVTAQLHWQGVLPNGDTLDRITIDVLRVTGGVAAEHWARTLSSRLTPSEAGERYSETGNTSTNLPSLSG